MGNTAGNRPLMQALASQQRVMGQQAELLKQARHENNVLRLQLAFVARMAGVSKELDAIRRQADIDNPAQPVPNPPSEQAAESTEEAVTPEAYDNPNQIGQTPGANEHVPAAAVDTPLQPGTSIPTSPYNMLENVSAPVSGTETHVPDNMTRIETDVRVGDPMNPETAFPLNPSAMGPSQQKGTTPPRDGEMSQTGSRNRMVASLRLARLQIAAGTARGEDLEVAAGIEANASLSDRDIRTRISALTEVVQAQGQRTAAQRPAGVVPRAASGGVQRTMPSLVPQERSTPITSVAGAVGAIDEDAEGIFL
jgi:hypothetical protein